MDAMDQKLVSWSIKFEIGFHPESGPTAQALPF